LKSIFPGFPVVFLTGPRQSGKTTLARATFPDFHYVNLEDPERRREAIEDPRGLLTRSVSAAGLILDEVQRAPDLLSMLQVFVDEGRLSRVLLTGSQQLLMSEKISQSLAGRAATLELLPFSLAEIVGRAPLAVEDLERPEAAPRERPRAGLEEVLFTGFFPPLFDRAPDTVVWLDSFLQTYVERDVRLLANVGDLDTFDRFLRLCAGRVGQLLNASSLAADAGVSHMTARRWLSLLSASFLVEVLRPHHRNFRKRLVKAPKLYFTDTGLLCRLLGVQEPAQLLAHPMRGAIFENFVVMELSKAFRHQGRRPPLYFWRDSSGREIDLLIDLGPRVLPVEVKAGMTVPGDAFAGLDAYGDLAGGRHGWLVYGGEETRSFKEYQVRAWWTCS
jgi:predicted AAA+ superfamily ATPase